MTTDLFMVPEFSPRKLSGVVLANKNVYITMFVRMARLCQDEALGWAGIAAYAFKGKAKDTKI